MDLTSSVFAKKLKIWYCWTIRFCLDFTSMWYKCFQRSGRDLRPFMLALARMAVKSFNGKITEKMIIWSDILLYHRWWCWHWKSKVAPHIARYVFRPHVSDIWTKSYEPNHTKFWAFRQKMIHHFWLRIDIILNDVSVTDFFDAKLSIWRPSSFSVP